MSGWAHSLEGTAGKDSDVVDGELGWLLGHPVVDGQVVLDSSLSDGANSAATKVMPRMSVRLGARGRPVVAVVDLGASVSQPGGCVTLQSSVRWDLNLMSVASEVVGKASPHVLD